MCSASVNNLTIVLGETWSKGPMKSAPRCMIHWNCDTINVHCFTHICYLVLCYSDRSLTEKSKCYNLKIATPLWGVGREQGKKWMFAEHALWSKEVCYMLYSLLHASSVITLLSSFFGEGNGSTSSWSISPRSYLQAGSTALRWHLHLIPSLFFSTFCAVHK